MALSKEEILNLLKPITIVKITESKKNENSDRLYVTQINTGNGTAQVVTGASNFKDGDIVPYLAVGQTVPGYLFTRNETIVLEKRKLRGYDSEGMLLAEDEIGLGEGHAGLMILDVSEDMIGKSLVDILTPEQLQTILDKAGYVEITPEIQAKINLLKSIAANGGELVGEDELPKIFASNEPLFTYDGFEPSGQMHIAQGIIRAINTNKMIDAGFTFRMWVADWFGYLNNKMGGDLEKIKKVGQYFIEIWKASGMDVEHVEFLWTSDFVGKREYWETVMKVSKSASLKRILRTTEIMGRSEMDDLSGAQILYPCMQVTDIFQVMKCQVTQLGMDQRKVNMLAREVGPELGYWKPVVLSHGMLQGLGKPLAEGVDATERAISMKMSKSKPDTAIFMTDTTEDVERKINNAYCPEGESKDNPILDYCKQIIFQSQYLKRATPLLKDGKFEILREERFGGNVSYSSYEELERDFVEKKLFPLDLKVAVIKALNDLLDPVRKHFQEDEFAKNLLEEVKGYQVTR
jgi:tyrosyl-tRNA synthetase